MKTEKVYIEFLVLKAQSGDSQALDDLLLLVHKKMLSYANRIMSGSVGVDDCVQESMLVLVKKLNRLNEVKSFHGWVYKILNSRCQDYFRKNKVSLELSDVDLNSQNHDHIQDRKIDINYAISKLSRRHQSVIYLFYFEGFRVAEIAQILGKPAGTIKSLLFDARTAIKSFLK